MAFTDDPWKGNYFNYFTEIEDHFRRTRGTASFMFSTLDWALLDAWKGAGIPLEAALRGIDIAFERWRAKGAPPSRKVNGLAWTVQAVTEEAARMAGNEIRPASGETSAAPFSREELVSHLESGLATIRKTGEFEGVVSTLEDILGHVDEHYANLEVLEQKLSALEDKMLATARSRQSEADLAEARRSLDAQLRPHRSKMTAPQLAMLEKQYLDRWLFEKSSLPRLSLFYLR